MESCPSQTTAPLVIVGQGDTRREIHAGDILDLPPQLDPRDLKISAGLAAGMIFAAGMILGAILF